MRNAMCLAFLAFFFHVSALGQPGLKAIIQEENLRDFTDQREDYYVVLQKGANDSLGVLLDSTKILPSTYKLRVSKKELREFLKKHPVRFVQRADRKPGVEARIRQHNFQINEISTAQAASPGIVGSQMQISVKENAYNTADYDIEGRANTDSYTSPVVELHATEMATLIAGAGNTFLTGLGVVPSATLHSADFSNLLPEPDSYFQDKQITVQNHSYGVGVEAYYGVESVAYDAQTLRMPTLVHSFSIGNSGTQLGGGVYEGIESYGTITGSFKQAKNVILSSSSDSLGVIPVLNSRGPAYDGRVKPDLVAFGGEGTSESAALVSGAVAFLQSSYEETHGDIPRSDLMRAILIAGAEDMLNEGPDFISGYGSMNLVQSARLLTNGWFFSGVVSQSESQSYFIPVPSNAASIRIALVWNDPEAAVDAPKALINDLDLQVDENGTAHLPWVLDASPNVSALKAPATRGLDRINNVELVTIDQPAQGMLELLVNGFEITGSQPFAIAYFIELNDRFEFTYPTKSDPIEASGKLNVYWNGNIPAGTLEASFDHATWQALDPTLDINSGQVEVSFPEGVRSALFRVVAADSIYYSDTIRISPSPQLKVDLYCEDELVLVWEDVDADRYEVQAYNAGNLEVIGETTDTVFQVTSNVSQSTLFRIIPKRQGKQLLQSFLINVDQQNAGCYINSLLVSTAFKQVELGIQLSGISQISTVSLYKSANGNPYSFFEDLPILPEQFLVDDEPAEGVTGYLLEVETVTGDLYQEAIEVFFAEDQPVVFPTIVTDGFLYLVSPESSGTMQVYNQQGVLVINKSLSTEVSFLDVQTLPAGIYHFKVFDRESKNLRGGKFIVR